MPPPPRRSATRRPRAAGSSPGRRTLHDLARAAPPARRRGRWSPSRRARRAARRRGRPAPPAAPGSRRSRREQRLGEDRAHARPHGVRPEGVRAIGAEHHRAADQRVRGPDHGADVARVGDAVQVDAGRLRLVGPDLPPDPDRPGPRAERREAVEQRRLDLGAAEPLARRGQQLDRLGPGRARGRSRSSPSPTNRPSRSRLRRLPRRRISFSFSLWGLVIVVMGPKRKRAAPLSRTARGIWLWLP